jgi:hypothetical protein
MKAMKKSVDDRGKEYAGDHEEHQARVEGIEPREQLACVGVKLGNGPHATENHYAGGQRGEDNEQGKNV